MGETIFQVQYVKMRTRYTIIAWKIKQKYAYYLNIHNDLIRFGCMYVCISHTFEDIIVIGIYWQICTVSTINVHTHNQNSQCPSAGPVCSSCNIWTVSSFKFVFFFLCCEVYLRGQFPHYLYLLLFVGDSGLLVMVIQVSWFLALGDTVLLLSVRYFTECCGRAG